MGSPTLIGTQTQELALADGVSSIITNVGSHPVYLGSYDGISDTNYEYLLNAGAAIEWNGYTRIYAVAGPNAPSAIQIFKNSNFMFDGYAIGKAVAEQGYRTVAPDVYQIAPDDGSATEYLVIRMQVPRGMKCLEICTLPGSQVYAGLDNTILEYNVQFLDTGGMKDLNQSLIQNGEPTQPFFPSSGNLYAFRTRGNGPSTALSAEVVAQQILIPSTGPWVVITINRANIVTNPGRTISLDAESIINSIVFSNKDIRFPTMWQDTVLNTATGINQTTMPQIAYYAYDMIDFDISTTTNARYIIPLRFGWDVEVAYNLTHTTLGTAAALLFPRLQNGDTVVSNAPLAAPLSMPLAANSISQGSMRFIHPPAPVELRLTVGTGNGTISGQMNVRYERSYG